MTHRPLLAPIIFFLSGILCTSLFKYLAVEKHALLYIAVLAFIVLLLLAAARRQQAFYIIFCIFFFILGSFRYASSVIPAGDNIANYVSRAQQEAVIYGTVTAPPEWKGAHYARHQKFPVRIRKILLGEEEHETTGAVLVNLFSENKDPEIGDEVVIGGEISLPHGARNPAGFDHKTYLKRLGVGAVVYSRDGDHYFETGVTGSPVLLFRRFLDDVRKKVFLAISRNLSGDARAITASVILGKRDLVSPGMNDAFIKTGTMHILAVSGLHIGIVAIVIMAALKLVRCPRGLMYAVTIAGISAFAVFAGGRPSSLRAALMGSFVLFGLLLGRKADIVNVLALSAFVITFFDPGQLFQTGFILSYMAVLSIIFLTPLTDPLLGISRTEFGGSIAARAKIVFLKSVSVSLAVWAGLLPVTAYYFRIITPSVVLANLLAVPVLFVLVALGFLMVVTSPLVKTAGIISIASAAATAFISNAITCISDLFIGSMRFLASMPLSYVRVPSPSVIFLAVYFAALIGSIIIFRKIKRSGAVILGFLLFAANLFVWGEALHKDTGVFRTTFFDVKKADAALLEFPDGSVMLIDAGSGGQYTGFGAGRNIIAPYLWQNRIRTIDCVLLTHDHEDHIGGLPYILENFKVGSVIDGGGRVGAGKEKALYEEFKDIIAGKNIKYLKVERGDIVEGLDSAKVFVLNPPRGAFYGDPNSDSIVVKVVTGKNNGLLFCADAGSKAMKDMFLFGPFLESDLVKIPHHGGGMGDMTIAGEFFNRTKCKYAVISTSKSYFSNDKLLKVLKNMEADVYLTSESGAIKVIEKESDLTVKKTFK